MLKLPLICSITQCVIIPVDPSHAYMVYVLTHALTVDIRLSFFLSIQLDPEYKDITRLLWLIHICSSQKVTSNRKGTFSLEVEQTI